VEHDWATKHALGYNDGGSEEEEHGRGQAGMTLEKSLRPYILTNKHEAEKETLGLAWALQNLKACFQWLTSFKKATQFFPHSSTNQGPQVQTYERVRAILTTQPA